MDSAEQMKQVFEGVKVADFSWAAVGPQVGRTLAEHGATVIRIESHHRPDVVRVALPFRDNIPGINRSSYYAMLNTNKYCIALDLSKLEGKKIARKLIGWADVVNESFTPGTMKKLGLNYEEAKKIKQSIIYCSTCSQGQYGPHASLGVYGRQTAPLCGFSVLTGDPDREPVMLYDAYTDYITPWYLIINLVAALDRRRKTGEGIYLDHSQYEAALSFLAPAILDYTVNGRIANRMGNRECRAAPHGAYPCRGDDRWVAIAVFTDEEWTSFCEVVGNLEWTSDPKFASLSGRKRSEGELDRLVGEWTVNYTAEQVMTLMQAKGVPAGVVQTTEDLFNDPQLKHREHFVFLEHKEIGRHAYHNEATRFTQTPPRFWKAAPCLGEDNEFVYKQILGLTDDEISDLLAEGVITTEADVLDISASQ